MNNVKQMTAGKTATTSTKTTRQEKALSLVETVGKKNDTTYLVPSQTNPDKVYEVVFLYGRKFGCDCPDFLCREIDACKHIHAVKFYMEDEEQK